MRLTSLDVFRGIAIAGMILVNQAGVADQVYPFLEHAEWHGCTLADLVFPFFLFIVGGAMTFSLSKYAEGNRPTADVYRQILRRAAILFILGLLLNGFWNYDFSNIRIMGVLQRISLAYLLAALIVLNVPRKGQWVLAALLLIGYWIAMSLIPVPDYGAGVLTREGNFGAYIDRLIVGTAHLYKGDNFNSMGDPEGLFSTLPAVVTVLTGYFTVDWIRTQPVQSRTSIGLVLFGIACLAAGWAWGLAFPINKKLWTSSFVLFTTGWALLLLAGCYEVMEVRKFRRWGKPFEVMGLNAIFAFVASVLLIKILAKTHVGTGETAPTTYNWIYENAFVSWAGAMNASLLFAIMTLLFWWAILYAMYRQKWFLKI
ncbi:acyltransferase family protein [Coleofasciculus sp. FACHB-712]|uniref:acyltransferase family protein n=1 Tax=Coleofasciculus sp. FACHB-712 TaxID=2692789 RepID=UPI00168281FE|nr:acyltransferase family protein [Coleofasciculus sp. FACHB-712]MBD1942360.1 acyltransferase family protein [Coleofasciculus sp. FACHB-712]